LVTYLVAYLPGCLLTWLLSCLLTYLLVKGDATEMSAQIWHSNIFKG